MQVLRDNPGRQLLSSSIVTIGNFDGLHLGHQALIRLCQSLAGSRHSVAVVTFEPLPAAWFQPDAAPARLMSTRQKLARFAELGVDLVDLVFVDRDNLGAFSFCFRAGVDEFAKHVSVPCTYLLITEDGSKRLGCVGRSPAVRSLACGARAAS